MEISHYPVSQETCIAFEDYARMGREDHTGVVLKNSPRWAMCNEKMREVVAHKICKTAGVAPVPTALEELRKVEDVYLAALGVQAAKPAAVEMKKHLETVQRHGGPLTFFISLLYRRYRLGMDSPELARQYGISPQNIRQQLNRCSLLARALFPAPEEHLPWHHSAKNKKPPITKRPRVFGRLKKQPRFCIVCGKEVPKHHSKFCGKICRRKNLLVKAQAQRKAHQARPVFCSAACKVQYTVRQH